MRELSLFTGAGGGLLGTKLLGWEPIGYVEWNEYCQQVIRARIEDGFLPSAPIFTDVREFVQSGAARQYRGFVDVVTAGFPCQPFSVAGKQAGADDERNMWPATRDVIRDVQPRSVLLENVPGLISCGYLGTVISDLASLGYVGRWGIIGAADCGAPHKRDRLWIVAHAAQQFGNERRNHAGSDSQHAPSISESGNRGDTADMAHAARELPHGRGTVSEQAGCAESSNGGEAVADSERIGQPGSWQRGNASDCTEDCEGQAGDAVHDGWWESDPADDPKSGVGRVAPRVANGMDRLKAIGNGQCSPVVERAWRCLA